MNAIPETTVFDRTDRWSGEPAGRHAAPIVDPLMNRKDRIGRFEVRGVIGCGSFGVVYEGYDRFRRRQVAIKVCSRCDPEARRRFVREAEIGMRLAHPNVMRVHELGIDRSTPYLVAEYLPGEDLADLIRRREPQALTEKLDILLQIAAGLDHAHSRGVIHRDVKPSNVRVVADGRARWRVKIMDFGSALSGDAVADSAETGIAGTLAYLAPECLVGQPASAGSDVFSWGVLAYELLAFRRPFDGPYVPAVIGRMLHGSPHPLRDSDGPAELAEIVFRCLDRDPAARCGSFAALGVELERVRARAALRAPGRPRRDGAISIGRRPSAATRRPLPSLEAA